MLLSNVTGGGFVLFWPLMTLIPLRAPCRTAISHFKIYAFGVWSLGASACLYCHPALNLGIPVVANYQLAHRPLELPWNRFLCFNSPVFLQVILIMLSGAQYTASLLKALQMNSWSEIIWADFIKRAPQPNWQRSTFVIGLCSVLF